MTQPQRQRNVERVLFGRAIVRSAEKKKSGKIQRQGRSATQGLVGFCSSSFWTSWSWCGCTLSVRAMTLKTLEPWNHATNRWSEVVSDHDLFSSCGRWSTTVLFPCSWFCFWAARKQNRFLAAFYISVFKWRCAFLLRLLEGPRLGARFPFLGGWDPVAAPVFCLAIGDLWPLTSDHHDWKAAQAILIWSQHEEQELYDQCVLCITDTGMWRFRLSSFYSKKEADSNILMVIITIFIFRIFFG